MLKDFEDADKENDDRLKNDYFAQRMTVSETAFEDMKSENLAEVSNAILKKANNSFFKGLMPGFSFND